MTPRRGEAFGVLDVAVQDVKESSPPRGSWQSAWPWNFLATRSYSAPSLTFRGRLDLLAGLHLVRQLRRDWSGREAL